MAAPKLCRRPPCRASERRRRDGRYTVHHARSAHALHARPRATAAHDHAAHDRCTFGPKRRGPGASRRGAVHPPTAQPASGRHSHRDSLRRGLMRMCSIRSLVALCALLIAWPAVAQQPVLAGRVKSVAGEAVHHASRRVDPRSGRDTTLFESDHVRTSANGRVGLTLRDDTRVSIGPQERDGRRDVPLRTRRRSPGAGLRFVQGVAVYVSGQDCQAGAGCGAAAKRPRPSSACAAPPSACRSEP